MSAGQSGGFVIEPEKPRPNYYLDRTLVASEWTLAAATGHTRGTIRAAR